MLFSDINKIERMSHSVDRAENASGVEHNGAMVDDPDIIMAVVENRAKEVRRGITKRHTKNGPVAGCPC